MNYNCKYCDYVDKCSRKCEYDSILCKVNRSFPKIVNRPYKEVLYENSDLKLENTNYKQALIDIRECCENNSIEVNTREWGNLIVTNIDDILPIIDKIIGDEKK